MKKTLLALAAVTALFTSLGATAQVTLHEDEDYQGRAVTAQQRSPDLRRSGLNDRASSAVVVGLRWQVCEDAQYGGYCRVLRPGQYPSLRAMGLNDRISSARPLHAGARVTDDEYAPLPVVAQDFRRGRGERLYEAKVTSARAVVGTPAQRCWIERENVVQQPQAPAANLPGAAIGAVIGGILGHQVGGGTGQQIATVGGAVGGAVLGSRYGRQDRSEQAPPLTQDVRRCDGNAAQATPSHWDVGYQHAGIEHHVQMTRQPGATVLVNRRGEPRV